LRNSVEYSRKEIFGFNNYFKFYYNGILVSQKLV
jgi:hypothetical protein